MGSLVHAKGEGTRTLSGVDKLKAQRNAGHKPNPAPRPAPGRGTQGRQGNRSETPRVRRREVGSVCRWELGADPRP